MVDGCCTQNFDKLDIFHCRQHSHSISKLNVLPTCHCIGKKLQYIAQVDNIVILLLS